MVVLNVITLVVVLIPTTLAIDELNIGVVVLITLTDWPRAIPLTSETAILVHVPPTIEDDDVVTTLKYVPISSAHRARSNPR